MSCASWTFAVSRRAWRYTRLLCRSKMATKACSSLVSAAVQVDSSSLTAIILCTVRTRASVTQSGKSATSGCGLEPFTSATAGRYRLAMNVDRRRCEGRGQKYLNVEVVQLRTRALERGVVLPWPFANCLVTDHSVDLGIGIPWARSWLKRQAFEHTNIDAVIVGGTQMLIREDYFTLGQVHASGRILEVLERTLTTSGVKVERSKIAKVFVSRNRGPRT